LGQPPVFRPEAGAALLRPGNPTCARMAAAGKARVGRRPGQGPVERGQAAADELWRIFGRLTPIGTGVQDALDEVKRNVHIQLLDRVGHAYRCSPPSTMPAGGGPTTR